MVKENKRRAKVLWVVQGTKPLEERNAVTQAVTEMAPAGSESMMPVGLNGKEPQISKPSR